MNKKLPVKLGDFTYCQMPIKILIDREFLLHFNLIKPKLITNGEPQYKLEHIEKTVSKIYQEFITARELFKKGVPFQLESFPYLKKKKEFYLLKNPKLSKNPIFIQLISDEYYHNAFVLSLFNDKELKDYFEQLFREFYFEYRFIAYLSKSLYFEAIYFDKSRKKQNYKESLILESSISYENENITILDKLTNNNDDFTEKITAFEDNFSDEELYKAYKALTKRQQEILVLSYIEEKKDKEIAGMFNISQQAVSKTRKKALASLSKRMEVVKVKPNI